MSETATLDRRRLRAFMPIVIPASKVCTLCGVEKGITNFEPEKRGDRMVIPARCKDCKKAYHSNYQRTHREEHNSKSRESYRRNPKRRYAQFAVLRQKRREFVRSKKDVPCADCGGRFHHAAMDFDHLRDKAFTLATKTTYSESTLKAEMEKCEVVCANCHRVRTWNRSHRG